MAQFNIENKTIENERLVIGPQAVYFLGPELTLRNCTLELSVAARNLILIAPRLINCNIEVKKELKNLPWYHAHLKGCRFKGALTGCDFGSWPDEPVKGSIEGCDFSEARLDACRFIGCDVSTLRFPSWPFFTLLEPVRRLDELRQVPWPGRVGTLVQLVEENPPELTAVTHSATVCARYWGATEEQIKAALRGLDGVIC